MKPLIEWTPNKYQNFNLSELQRTTCDLYFIKLGRSERYLHELFKVQNEEKSRRVAQTVRMDPNYHRWFGNLVEVL